MMPDIHDPHGPDHVAGRVAYCILGALPGLEAPPFEEQPLLASASLAIRGEMINFTPTIPTEIRCPVSEPHTTDESPIPGIDRDTPCDTGHLASVGGIRLRYSVSLFLG